MGDAGQPIIKCGKYFKILDESVPSDEEVTHCGVRGPVQGVRVDGVVNSFIVPQVLYPTGTFACQTLQFIEVSVCRSSSKCIT